MNRALTVDFIMFLGFAGDTNYFQVFFDTVLMLTVLLFLWLLK